MAFERLRGIVRAGTARSEDPRDIERLLDGALKRRMGTSGDAVQFLGFAHTPASYATWRSEQLANLPNATVPTLAGERWPMVLWVMKPAGVSAFVRNGTARGLYVAPQVGMFTSEVAREVALAAMIAAYLNELPGTVRVQIAPPILMTIVRRAQARLATLERAWMLPATEAVGVRR